MSFEDRLYQDAIITAAREKMLAGHRSVLITSPTGSGKTVLIAKMIKAAEARGMSSWFNVHRRELVKQSMETFDAAGIQYGVIAAGRHEEPGRAVQIASIGTLVRRRHRFGAPKLIVWDECHHTAAASWAEVHAAYPGAFHIGLTATPERLDGRGLGAFFETMVQGPTTAWLIENGYLSNYRLILPPRSARNLSGVSARGGDYARGELAAVVDRPTITGDAVNHYLKYANGKRAVVFAVTIDHSKHVVERFKAAGVRAAHVDGETDAQERDEAVEAFREGRLEVLSNVELFGEGFDLPAIEAVVDLAPTMSLAKYLQRCGRGLRPHPGKEAAIMLDHAGNVERHGLPDAEREWSLEGRGPSSRRGERRGPPIRTCERCRSVMSIATAVCKFCGYIFRAAGEGPAVVAGELVEVDPKLIRRQQAYEQHKADTLEKLIELGRSRNYKRPREWAEHIMRYRNKQKAAAHG